MSALAVVLCFLVWGVLAAAGFLREEQRRIDADALKELGRD